MSTKGTRSPGPTDISESVVRCSPRVGAGADGKAKLSFVGKGPGLGLQAYQPSGLYIPGGELLVELHAGASCWSAQYVNFGEKPSIRETNRYRTKGGQ